jgi:DNA-binding transcriptional MerR regulator
LKTVAELAKETGVSVQTIYRRLNSVKQIHGDGLTEKKNGITYITAKGEVALTGTLTDVKQSDVKMFNAVKHPESEETLFLREQLRTLTEELNREREHSRGQADRLADLAGQLAELSRNNQILLGAEQTRTNPVLLTGGDGQQGETEPVKKKAFWNFFKKK